jgi:hypothetical protein
VKINKIDSIFNMQIQIKPEKMTERIRIQEIHSILNICPRTKEPKVSFLVGQKIYDFIKTNSMAKIKKILVAIYKIDPFSQKKWAKYAFVDLEWLDTPLAKKIQQDLHSTYAKSIIDVCPNLQWEITFQDKTTNLLQNTNSSVTSYVVDSIYDNNICDDPEPFDASHLEEDLEVDGGTDDDFHCKKVGLYYRDQYVDFILNKK